MIDNCSLINIIAVSECNYFFQIISTFQFLNKINVIHLSGLKVFLGGALILEGELYAEDD